MNPVAARPAGLALAMSLGAVLLLSACGKAPEKTEDIRPVRTLKVTAEHVGLQAEFAGEVRARVESRLGFRVAGKVVARQVEVGSIVKRGQPLMQLDPADLQLAQGAAQAALTAAESNRDLAAAELKRYQDLRAQGFVSQAVLDAKETAYKAAKASADQASASLRNQTNQAGYATLVADMDGVVTSLGAEVGQVVAAGTPVVGLARLGEKEVVFAIPENKVDLLRKIPEVKIRTWARPDEVLKGRIREISPIADPATRTYTAKVTIPGAGDEVKLGMTAYVSFQAPGAQAMVKVPLSALVHAQNTTSVWVVENGSVKPLPVQVATASGNDILLAGGLTEGQVIVTAGANLLKPGQKVLVVKDAQPAAPAATAAASASSAVAGAAK